MPTPPADQWGLLKFPTDPAVQGGESKGAPALWTYLQFYQAYLQTDGNVLDLWTSRGMAPNRVVVNAIRAHDPRDNDAATFGGGLAEKDLPALYLWGKEAPEASQYEWIADDWPVQTRELRLLWVSPRAETATARVRSSFDDALAKAIFTATERGRTPSFVVAGDTDPTATTRGSYVHSFTGVFSLNMTHSGPAKVQISVVGPRAGQSPTFVLPACEMRFELKENLVFDPNMWSFPSKLQQTVTLGNPMLPPWAPLTLFTQGNYILATPPAQSALYIFLATIVTGAGMSGSATPVWPTTTGATVADGNGGSAITWTCIGPAPAPYALVGTG